ncbi:efflux RND transporter periplasmic adaptor subunit [endosymbiont of unidentified scaly snail isolate Monju]|uniref:efflux RND transporter periplasmic adaptor subunit n=1 Tax=endosymbiont of unidentified scaly snail isolate Monju TaxID=1248727 RepID=UPI0003892384|nr:efflux RND transporter periplasmic adaptor subunit [endosymbiont of unidentified scaly snail isolate Monju]BAN68720.1 RND superfamily efflux transporter MFP subunit [endosymbiont of unidentified scaly snail isolate Monju]
MNLPRGRMLTVGAVLLPLLVLFAWTALRAGPLAPIAVRVTPVVEAAVRPGLFGIGTVEARDRYHIGPTQPGRLAKLGVDVGDRVRRRQVLAVMDDVDLGARIQAQQAAIQRARSAVREAQARLEYAERQLKRYERLRKVGSTSEELVATKRLERRIADAALQSTRDELNRLRHELEAQRRNLTLISPVDGVVVARNAIPGDTLVAGQAVVELIDPQRLWVNARFDQVSAEGLVAGLQASIVLRSRASVPLTGQVLRLEPLADAVTEEMLAKIGFDRVPDPLPPLGELAEVTVRLAPLPARPVVPNAALRRVDGELGVWVVDGESLRFAPVRIGARDLDGRVQVLEGLSPGEQVVIHNEKPLRMGATIRQVERLPGVKS